MRFRSKKGGMILKILSVIAFILLILSIEVPRRAWNEQAKRTDLARKRMIEMSDCEIVYLQEKGSFSKDLKAVYDFASNFDSLMVSRPDIDIEILDIDTTKIRVSFTQVKHFKDLEVVPKGGDLDNIEEKGKFTSYLESVGCPTASLIMDSDAEEIEMLLKGETHKDHYRWLKEKFYKSSENETEKLFNAGKDISVTLQLRNPNLGLKSYNVHLSSRSNILAVANYKGEKDIFWDFVSKDQISIEIEKDQTPEVQNVNMARYVFPDFETDKTPYLCPSTLEQFKVSFNLSAQVGMNITFLKEGMKNFDAITKDKDVVKLADNQILSNYYLNTIRLRAERNVADFVREYEMDGDSTYSSDEQKTELFKKFFAERMKDFVEKEPLKDELKKTIDSPEDESEKRFSEQERFNLLFAANPGASVSEEMKKEENREALSMISCFYSTEILKVDTVSVKIESPIDENSDFKGYSRNILQKKFLFGIDDDKNAGYVDNGTPSWRNE
ncbi:MAG: hypothetical protein JXN63_04965 [Candidatus Delongbacteria bacterium]|nr:hypothetical protein [Candidatus Delongbacteria bacterium]